MIAENEISRIVFDTALRLHRQYSPGLFESVYEELIHYELTKKDLYIERKKEIPLIHETVKMEIGFRADLIIEKK